MKSGDVCNVIADWLKPVDKAKRVRIMYISDYPTPSKHIMKFAKIEWLGKKTEELLRSYGDLFALDELKIVKGKE